MRERESTINSLADLEKTIGGLTKEQFAKHSYVLEASDSGFSLYSTRTSRTLPIERDGIANRKFSFGGGKRFSVPLRQKIVKKRFWGKMRECLDFSCLVISQ